MQVVDQEMFLEDMMVGDLSSNFCNPFLVNSILAVASVSLLFFRPVIVPR